MGTDLIVEIENWKNPECELNLNDFHFSRNFYREIFYDAQEVLQAFIGKEDLLYFQGIGEEPVETDPHKVKEIFEKIDQNLKKHKKDLPIFYWIKGPDTFINENNEIKVANTYSNSATIYLNGKKHSIRGGFNYCLFSPDSSSYKIEEVLSKGEKPKKQDIDELVEKFPEIIDLRDKKSFEIQKFKYIIISQNFYDIFKKEINQMIKIANCCINQNKKLLMSISV